MNDFTAEIAEHAEIKLLFEAACNFRASCIDPKTEINHEQMKTDFKPLGDLCVLCGEIS